MFVQVIEGKVRDADLLIRQTERWQAEVKPKAKGYLGSTGGITPDGNSVWVVRFDSEESARANSARPEQGTWWSETAKAYDGEPAFYDCTEVDMLLGGGSDEAGFVQVIEGRAKDPAELRRRIPEMEGELRTARPDILGLTVAWHGDRGFSQIAYFSSEAEARKMEKETDSDSTREEFRSMFEGEPTFYDLPDPRFD